MPKGQLHSDLHFSHTYMYLGIVIYSIITLEDVSGNYTKYTVAKGAHSEENKLSPEHYVTFQVVCSILIS